MKKLLIAAMAAAGVFAVGTALADLTVKDANSVDRIIVNFVCQTTKFCNATTLIRSSDSAEIGGASLPLRVDPTGTTPQPATQSGTWTVQPGNTANSVAWLVTGAGGTFPSTQSGTWTVQPGNTANTTPWLTSISQGGNTALVKAANTVGTSDMAAVVAVANTQTAVTPGDGVTTTIYGTAPASPVIGVPLLWNGTTYDRQKSAGATGVAAVRQTDGTTNSTMKAASTPAVAGDTAMVVDQRPGTNISQSPYPATAVPYTATNTGTTGATTATLAGASSVTTYICGFSIRANATAAATGNATVTGVITATMNFTQWTAPNASGLGITEMIFSPCIPASGTNQSVAVVSAAPGTGGVVSVTAWGYKL